MAISINLFKEGRYVITYGGKFQPFHPGHFYVFNKLLNNFLPNRVFITTTEVKKFDDDHFLTFEEKVKVMNKLFNIPKNKIIKVKNNYYPIEILSQFPEDTMFIAVVGYKDAERLNRGKYFLPFRENDSFYYSYKDHGYFLVSDGPKINASDLREYFRSKSDKNKLKKYFISFYKKFDEEIFNIFYNRLTLKNLKEEELELIEEDNENELNEGGSFGHILNIWEDFDLTFYEIKKILTSVPEYKVDNITEKFDGIALSVTVKGDEVYAARNNTELKNFGEKSLNKEEFFKKYSENDNIDISFREGFEVIEKCLKDLIKKENLFKFFKAGKSFLHFEIINNKLERIINYKENYIIFHQIIEYNYDGRSINSSTNLAKQLYELIKKHNLDYINNYKIFHPDIIKFNLDKNNIEKLINYLFEEFNKLYIKYNINDETKIFDYLYNNLIKNINEEIKNNNEFKNLLINAIYDPTKFKEYKRIKDKNVLEYWNSNYENLKEEYYKLIFEIKKIIISYTQKLFKYITNLINPFENEEIEKIKERLNKSIEIFNNLKSNLNFEDLEKYKKILNNLSRNISEIENFNLEILPTEGIVFFYNGKIYKLTGLYSLLNKIIGDVEMYILNNK